jgi:K(+)-stimulated pyrophosphate-energized sodium pump
MDADKNVKVEIKNVNGKAKATVTTSEKGNVNVQVFEGSLEDVKAKVEALK